MTELVHGHERLRRLQSLTDAALAHLELEDLLAAVLDRARELLDADTCAVLMLDESGEELVSRAAVGIEQEVEQEVRIPVRGGFAGRIVAEGRPVILEDVDRADVLNPILRRQGIKSLVGVPLLVGGESIGVLHVGTRTYRDFASDEVELLQLAADRIAIAIEHARLYAAEHAARTRLEQLQAVTDVALAHLELDELLATLLPRIREILNADTCAVLLLDDARAELVARAAVGIEEEVEQGVRIPVGRGFAGRVVAEERPIVLDDVDHADVLNPILRQKGIKSLLGVPLVAGGRAIGVLHVGTLVHRKFTRSDTELLEVVADRVAVAIERARLHEEAIQLDELQLNFAAIASHELRTPATAVYGALATLVERHDIPPETRQELVRAGYEHADRLRRLLDQLLDLSRLDAKAVRIAAQPVELRRVLTEIVDGAVPGARVEVDVPAELVAHVDAVALERIVSNLLTNAARYGKPPIRVTGELAERRLRVGVEDHGEGVPADIEPRLFQRFARRDDAAGTGLGLAIARTYARAHGGDLVYDRASSRTRFEVSLPQR